MTDSDISAPAALAALLGFSLAAFAGYAAGGYVGALFGALAGATVLVVLNAQRQRKQTRRLPLETMRGLSPEQAMNMLAVRTGDDKPERQMPAFKSDVVAQIEEALEETKGEPRAALARIEQLREKYPRSAAVWAELVRRRLEVEEEANAWEALHRALELCLDGGMNSLAARLVREFPQGREQVQLSDDREIRLQRALEAQP
jgi:hypothetical protein